MPAPNFPSSLGFASVRVVCVVLLAQTYYCKGDQDEAVAPRPTAPCRVVSITPEGFHDQRVATLALVRR